MKRLKFSCRLEAPIISGHKTKTIRLFDDKDLKVGDELELENDFSHKVFSRAIITEIVEKKLKEISDEDLDGHAQYPTRESMIKEFTQMYGDSVTEETPAKIISFELSHE